MRTPHVWPYYSPSSVGALMDPGFLREAVNDAGVQGSTGSSSESSGASCLATVKSFLVDGRSGRDLGRRGRQREVTIDALPRVK